MTNTNLKLKAAEQNRCTAMLNNDLVELDTILDPRLTFHHANGGVDDKTAYMEKMQAGRIEYLAIDWPELRTIDLPGDTALMSGHMVTKVKVDGVKKLLNNRVLSVWTMTDDCWRLIAFQSTPIT